MSDMSFSGKLLTGAEVRWKPLREVAEFQNAKPHERFVCEDGDIALLTSRFISTEGRSARYVKGEDVLTPAKENDVALVMSDLPNGRALAKAFFVKENDRYAANQRVCLLRVKDSGEYVPKFLYYVMNRNRQLLAYDSGYDQTHLKKDWILEVSIPVPSLAEQKSIVRILDTFTELTAELTARKKQYNYYRDHLLRFEDGDVEWKPLRELGEFIRGKRFTKADYVDTDGVPVIHYGEIYTRYGVFTNHSLSQVRNDMEGSLRYAEPGDVVITDVGETIEDVGKAVAWLGGEKVAIHDHCYAFRHSMDPTFVSYCMQTTSFIAEKAKYIASAKVNTLLIKGFSNVSIPVPYPNDPEKSLAEQARIVSILNKFSTLTSSIKEGLPREIGLRQKQYE